MDYIPVHEVTPGLLHEKIASLLSQGTTLRDARQGAFLDMNGARNLARAIRPFLDR